MRTSDLGALGVECVELAQGVSFIMDAPSLLSVTGYKVLRSQEQGCYVPCVRSRINGHEKLTYLTEGSPTLASCLEGTAGRSGQRLLRSLVEAVQSVEDNGFLSPQSVLVEPDKVFVDVSTGSCMLVCLPLTRYPASGDLGSRQAVFELCATACATLFGTSSPLAGIERSVEYRTGSLAAPARGALARRPRGRPLLRGHVRGPRRARAPPRGGRGSRPSGGGDHGRALAARPDARGRLGRPAERPEHGRGQEPRQSPTWSSPATPPSAAPTAGSASRVTPRSPWRTWAAPTAPSSTARASRRGGWLPSPPGTPSRWPTPSSPS